jgi:hypothetical protein
MFATLDDLPRDLPTVSRDITVCSLGDPNPDLFHAIDSREPNDMPCERAEWRICTLRLRRREAVGQQIGKHVDVGVSTCEVAPRRPLWTPCRGHPAQPPPLLRHRVAETWGAALQDVQDALVHADPRTTRRYDRSRHSLDRSPNYLPASALTQDS